jgi:putative chitobiose transport system permease protein
MPTPAAHTPEAPWVPYAYLALPVALLGVFFALPSLWALWMSVHDYANLYHPTWAGLSNYTALLHMPDFRLALVNTLAMVAIVVPALVTLPIILALLLNQRLPGMDAFKAIAYLPVVTSLVAVGIAWKWLFAADGLINAGLHTLGLSPVGWLTDPQWALWAVSTVIVWKGLAYYAMIYLAQLQAIAPQLYEAAELDGASGWRQHWHITVPLLRPTMMLVGLISLIGGLKTFTEIYVMTRGGPLHATETLVYLIYQWAFERLDLGLACAAGVVLAGVLVAGSVLQMRVLQGENERAYQ